MRSFHNCILRLSLDSSFTEAKETRPDKPETEHETAAYTAIRTIKGGVHGIRSWSGLSALLAFTFALAFTGMSVGVFTGLFSLGLTWVRNVGPFEAGLLGADGSVSGDRTTPADSVYRLA